MSAASISTIAGHVRLSHVPMSQSQLHPPFALHSIKRIQEPGKQVQAHSPKVPRPPMGIVPSLLKGTENVTTFGVTSRITMTFAGSAGISLEDILLLFLSFDDEENGFNEMYPLTTPMAMAAAGNKRKAVPRGPGPFLGVGLLCWRLFLGENEDEKLLAAPPGDARTRCRRPTELVTGGMLSLGRSWCLHRCWDTILLWCCGCSSRR